MQRELTFAAEKPVSCTSLSMETPSTVTSRIMTDSSRVNAGADATGRGADAAAFWAVVLTLGLGGIGTSTESASTTSAAHLTSVAPFRMRSRHPALRGESTLPGTAITVRPMSEAMAVVMRVPLFIGASIAMTPAASEATT